MSAGPINGGWPILGCLPSTAGKENLFRKMPYDVTERGSDKGAISMLKLVGLERQAFGLGEEGDPTPPSPPPANIEATDEQFEAIRRRAREKDGGQDIRDRSGSEANMMPKRMPNAFQRAFASVHDGGRVDFGRVMCPQHRSIRIFTKFPIRL